MPPTYQQLNVSSSCWMVQGLLHYFPEGAQPPKAGGEGGSPEPSLCAQNQHRQCSVKAGKAQVQAWTQHYPPGSSSARAPAQLYPALTSAPLVIACAWFAGDTHWGQFPTAGQTSPLPGAGKEGNFGSVDPNITCRLAFGTSNGLWPISVTTVGVATMSDIWQEESRRIVRIVRNNL